MEQNHLCSVDELEVVGYMALFHLPTSSERYKQKPSGDREAEDGNPSTERERRSLLSNVENLYSDLNSIPSRQTYVCRSFSNTSLLPVTDQSDSLELNEVNRPIYFSTC